MNNLIFAGYSFTQNMLMLSLSTYGYLSQFNVVNDWECQKPHVARRHIFTSSAFLTRLV